MAAHVCPGCGSKDIHRSTHVPWIVRVIPRLFLGVRPYRCVECWTRFWDRPFPASRGDEASRARCRTARRRASRAGAIFLPRFGGDSRTGSRSAMMPLPAPDSSIFGVRSARPAEPLRRVGGMGWGGAGIRTEIETSPARASRHLQRKKQPRPTIRNADSRGNQPECDKTCSFHDGSRTTRPRGGAPNPGRRRERLVRVPQPHLLWRRGSWPGTRQDLSLRRHRSNGPRTAGGARRLRASPAHVEGDGRSLCAIRCSGSGSPR